MRNLIDFWELAQGRSSGHPMIRMGQVDFLAFEENGEMSWAGPCKGGGPPQKDERRFLSYFF